MSELGPHVLTAPAKLNLCLYLGGTRDDGLHELCSVFTPISLADRLVISDGDAPFDEVICPGIAGPDLTARALEALRRVAGEKAVALIRRVPDETIMRIVAGWATRFDASRAEGLGFVADRSFEDIIQAHVEDELAGTVKAG